MSDRKSFLPKVSSALVMILMIFFNIPSMLFAEEKSGAIDELSLYELRNLEVSIATKTKTTVQEAPSIVSVITADEIRNLGARSIIDVLRTVPGFDFTTDGSFPAHKTVVRGMNSSLANDKIKIMMDGHSMSARFGEPYDVFDRLPLENIRQIEIIRGPGSALYGTGAFIGVINIITKKGGDKPSEVSVSGGSYGTFKTHGELSYKKDDLKVYAYADYGSTDGYHGLIESDAMGKYPRSNAPGNVNTNDENHTFQTNIGYKDFYFSGFFEQTSLELPVGVAKALTDGVDDANSTLAFAEAGYRLNLRDKGSILFKAYYDYSDQNTRRVEIYAPITAANVFGWKNGLGIYGSPLAKNSIMGGELTADYKVYDGIQLVVGTSYEKFRLYEQAKQMSIDDLKALPTVRQKLTESENKLEGYRKILLSEYGSLLQLRTYSVVSIGFERLIWEEPAFNA